MKRIFLFCCIAALILSCSGGGGGGAALVSIAITPAAPAVARGYIRQFTATGTFSDGAVRDLGASAAWSSSDAGTATISTAGLATGVKTGSVTLTAESGGKAGTATLTVSEPIVLDGRVSAIAVADDGTVYIGGSFHRAGPATGGFVPIDANTGLAGSAFPKVNGSVYALAPDGSGGICRRRIHAHRGAGQEPHSRSRYEYGDE